MAASFNFFRVNKFPQAPSTPGPLALGLADKEIFGVPAQTRVELKDADLFAGTYEVYHVYHECLRKKRGRTYEGTEFDVFFEKSDFTTFLSREENLLMCMAPKRVSRHFVDTVNRLHPVTFNVDYLNIDFSVIRSRLKEVRGVWVSQVQQPHVDVIALFGRDVDQSEIYRTAESLGTASSLLVAYDFGGSTHLVILSSQFGIAFPEDLPIPQYFSIVRHMMDHLLVGAVKVEHSKHNRRAGVQSRSTASVASRG